MEFVFCRWVLLAFLLIFRAHSALAVDGLNGDTKVRGVNLGGWLVLEGWIKPSLFDGIPNGDMLDGTQVQFKSVSLNKYVSAQDGEGQSVSIDRDGPSSWETFRNCICLMIVVEIIHAAVSVVAVMERASVTATSESPSSTETFHIERNNNNRVHIKLSSGTYLQASSGNELTADYPGVPGWDDNAATFEMTIVANTLHGDYQLANGYGHDKAKEVLSKHRSSYIRPEDFQFLSEHGINTMMHSPGHDGPYNMKCIIDLHADPGSQNGMEHSSSRDGSTDWPTSQAYISQSLDVIEFLASRYGNHPALLGIELLNEPSASGISLDILVSYYSKGYQIVRNHSSTAYVIMCQRIGNADPLELYHANIDKLKWNPESLNAANGPLVFIGEWVNEWSVANGSRMDYEEFGRAQLDVYDTASFGWAYWTLKNDRNHWDLEWNIKNDYLQLGGLPNKQIQSYFWLLVSSCSYFLLAADIVIYHAKASLI
ncbi:hypothetical protein MKW98_028782 [Papaver atlanticum]|uniref:Mannan endo-1,4-beta-mannosidase n=1 Tax=Papaver atlanticum TaxID=357466 RepID=A0AAD4S9S3_9MAGN|nr:hypothetical protein MKW98_028782 [Papaver atlanticum]